MDEERLTAEDYAIARSNGISRQRAYQRFWNNGWDKQRAITQPLNSSLWRTYGKICEENGVSRYTFYYRIRKGMKPEEAVRMLSD